MGFFYFLKKKNFYKQLFFAVVLTVILLWISLKALDIYTRHGDVYVTPDFKGKTLTELKQEGFDDYFDFQIIDSVYDKTLPRGSVFMQNPEPGSKIKKGRRMYLTIVASMPEKVHMPDLKNLSLRQAMVTLEVNGLETGNLQYVDYFALNAVIDQLVNDEPIEPGTEIYRGTVVDLVVGKGTMEVNVTLPFLIGKTPEQAVHDLHYASLNIGKEIYMDDNKHNARVYKTEPPQIEEVTLYPGDTVNIWYRSADDFDFDSYINEILGDTIPADSINQENNPLQ